MQRLFRALERHRVAYLLIGGQASIGYGAASFSEDVDIWVAPAATNLRRLHSALQTLRAAVYKLTPAFSIRYVRAGHGFHFVIPTASLPLYLDVMGAPPRAGGFAAAMRRAGRIRTSSGAIPVVGIPGLVRMKRTRRPSDYDTLSNLVRIRLAESSPTRSTIRWAIAQTFRVEDLDIWVRRWPGAVGRRPAARWLRAHPGSLVRARQLLAREMAAAQSDDARHWRRRIAELRRLRSADALLPEGLPVSRVPPP